eukprot:1774414-Pyramimonas_sp.AAC.1
MPTRPTCPVGAQASWWGLFFIAAGGSASGRRKRQRRAVTVGLRPRLGSGRARGRGQAAGSSDPG